MTKESISTEKKTRTYSKLGRKSEVTSLQALEESSKTQQEIADQHDVPRTTLQSWLYRNRGMQGEIDQELVAFYESPAGLAHLHQLMTALLYTFHKASGCGIPTLQEFLKISQLDQFVAKSTGALHKTSTKMDQVIIDFGKSESERLSANMRRKNISVVADETFLPHRMILVMMEPVSNYIIAEEVRERRDAITWYDVCASNLKELNVKVIQLSSDEGSGLSSFATKLLGVHKAPDLFHVLQDITKSMGGHLARATVNAEKRVEESSEKILKAYKKAQDLLEVTKNGEAEKFEKQAKEASRWDKQKEEDVEKLQKLKDDRELVSQTRKSIGSFYHPFCLETGKKRTPDELELSLNNAYDQLETVLSRNGGSEKQKKRLDKSRRMVPSLKQTLAFFWCYVATLLTGLSLEGFMLELFCHTLLPLSYLKTRLQRCRDKEVRLTLEKAIDALEATLNSRDGPWIKLSEEERSSLTAKADECSQIFQRSSSCVEGRNGVLSLIHHGHKQLSVQRLKVLSIIHNFGITRRDNTTAAERFFGQAPKSLFDYLLKEMNWPLRPRRSWPSSRKTARA